jgi:hypothetical protein
VKKIRDKTKSARAWDLGEGGSLLQAADSPLAIALAVTIVVIISTFWHIPGRDTDSVWYIALAEGRIATVVAPFSGRFLLPLLARALATLTHQDLASAFAVIAYGSCFTIVYCVASLLKRLGLAPLWCAPFILTPLLIDEALHAYTPDVFHAALIAAFFYFFAAERWRAALLFLFLATLTRESTLLLCFVIVAFEFRGGRRRMALGAAGTGVLGSVICALIARHGQPNIHALNSMAYLALKVPYNLLKNWFGIVLWTNTFEWKSATTFAIRIPRWLPAGHLRELGLGPWAPEGPLTTMLALLTVFGLAATVAVKALAKQRGSSLKAIPRTVTLSLWYGVIALALGTVTGAGVTRLVGYGWPAFWIGVPVFLANPGFRRSLPLPKFLLAHSALCWMPAAVAYFLGEGAKYIAPQVGVAILLHVYAWKILPSSRPFSPGSSVSTVGAEEVIDKAWETIKG